MTETISAELALQRGSWWKYFASGDVDSAVACLAPDVRRIGPRSRDANNEQCGRGNYAAFMREIVDTMPRLNESVVHDAVLSPDGRRVYLHFTELDSMEPHSTEKVVEAKCVMISHLNDDGLVALVDIYWREPLIDFEWAGTQRS